MSRAAALVAVLLAVAASGAATVPPGTTADPSGSLVPPGTVVASTPTTVTSVAVAPAQLTVSPVPDAAPVGVAASEAVGGDRVLAQGATSSCQIWDISACVTESMNAMLRAAVADVVNPALTLLSQTWLQTPAPSSVPRLAELWNVSWELALALYGVVVLAGGLLVMAHQSLQTHTGVREIAPRLVAGFLAGWASWPITEIAVGLANAISARIVGAGVDPTTAAAELTEVIQAALAGGPGNGFWLLQLFGAAIGVVLIALLIGYVLRVTMTILLVAGAPLALMGHALPQTEGVARWWWRALFGLLSVQIIQALTLMIGLRVLLAPDPGNADGGGVLGLPGSGWVSLLVILALLWVLWRIPGWVWSTIQVRGGGRSVLGTAVRAAIALKTGGLLRAALAIGHGSRSRPGSGAGGAAHGPGGGPNAPYARIPVTAGGQLALPLPGLRRRRSPRTTGRPATAGPSAGGSGSGGPVRPGAGQLALPLAEGVWPEQRPVVGRDGQWRLPINAPRVPRRDPGSGATVRPGRQWEAGRGQSGPAATARGQLRLPLAEGVWPEQRPVAGRDGQWRLPIDAPRAPRRPSPPPPPASSPAAPVPRRRAPRGRQLSIDDLDPFAGNRALRDGQYPLPLPGTTRHPRPPRPPAPPPAAGTRAMSRRPGPGQTRLPPPRPHTPTPNPPRPAPSRPAPSRPAPPRSAPSRSVPPVRRPTSPPSSPGRPGRARSPREES